MLLKISDIRTDSKFNIRQLDEEAISDYSAILSGGNELPKPTVFYDGQFYWAGDGRHRMQAHLKSGRADIEVIVKNGTERDAYLFGLEANQKHGLRLSSADKRKAVVLMVLDEEWSKWSKEEIARRCGVSSTVVTNVKASLEINTQSSPIFKLGDDCEMIGKEEAEITYKNPKSGESKMKSPANKHKQRATHSNTPPSTQNKGKPFSWKEFYADFGRLFRQIGKLQAVPPYDAQYLESQLIVWKDTFKRMYAENTGKEPEKEVAELCTSKGE